MVVVVILVRRRLVKICVNLACWEKVIDSEKLARAQRISQEPLKPRFSTGVISPSPSPSPSPPSRWSLKWKLVSLLKSVSFHFSLSFSLRDEDKDKGKTQRQRQQLERGCFKWEVHPHSKFKLASPSSFSLSLWGGSGSSWELEHDTAPQLLLQRA